mmetsp:Transcript_14671/g.63523  ORF Transcript_14671/g.63523 Transcript_14671/m.63523 type:complete len:275 (-) Transcript_14671:124-948(-)
MSYHLNNGVPLQLDGNDTAPPPLPPWLKGFLVTSKKREDVAAAGREIANLCNDLFFKLAYDDLGVPASMVKPGETEVPYDFAEPLLIPGCPGSVFVALRPDNNTVNVRMIAEDLIEEADKVGAAGWTKTSHVQRLIPVERVAPEFDLDRLAAAVIDEHFPRVKATDDVKPGHKLPTFRVHYEEHSAAMHLHKIDVEKKVADMVPSDYEVNLNDPTLTILVSVAGGSCMMSVVQGYASHEKFHHFHIHSASDLSPKKGTGMPASVWTQPGRAQAA